MDITAIPFNQFLGIKKTERDPPYLLELDDLPSYLNHVGTVHAAAQLALAEAGGAECLLRAFQDPAHDAIAVVRTVQAKFKKPLQGRAFAKAWVAHEELQRFLTAFNSKGRGLIGVSVEIANAEDVVAMSATIEWFIQRHTPRL